MRHSGWGAGLFDFNNDGWKDLFTANSHVNDRVEVFESAVYKEANSVFANTRGVFQDVSAEAGLTLVKAHRGAAFADFDGDGRVDAVVSSLGAPAELWENVSPEPRHWLVLRRGTRAIATASDHNPDRGPIRRDDTTWYASSGASGVHFDPTPQHSPKNRNPVAQRNPADPARRAGRSGAKCDRTRLRNRLLVLSGERIARNLGVPVHECALGIALPRPDMQRVERRQAEAIGALEQMKKLSHELRRTRMLRIHASAISNIGADQFQGSVRLRLVNHDLGMSGVQDTAVHVG